ncbi:hypothetical protein H8356DRAFT_1355936 [Neocallimastix lanati (nom. inval.)]|nr:hypothetical protein H8356DRAFT_1355936 [Neocallimastix sp. JGI-2020a]
MKNDVNLNHTVFPNDNTTEKIEGNTLNEKNQWYDRTENANAYDKIYDIENDENFNNIEVYQEVERKNETNKNCETNYTEIWNNLPEIDANKVFNPNTEHESLKKKFQRKMKNIKKNSTTTGNLKLFLDSEELGDYMYRQDYNIKTASTIIYKKSLLNNCTSVYLMISELKERFSETGPSRLFEIENENKEIRN